MTAAPADVPLVHVNALRWFVERDGGAEFVRSHGDEVHDEVIGRALAASYPAALQVLTALGASGVGADCWFTVDDSADPLAAREAEATARAVDVVRSAASPPGASLGGLTLSVGGAAGERIAAQAAVTGLTCTGPDDEAIALAAVALAGAFGPQVVWDGRLDEVMLVDAGMTPDQVRARWRAGGVRPATPRSRP